MSIRCSRRFTANMKRWLLRWAICFGSVYGCLPMAIAAPGRIKHIIHISVDGLRGDFLRTLIESPDSPYVTFQRLRAEGAVTFNARCDYALSLTVPNHTTMLTGRPSLAEPPLPPDLQHGYTANTSSFTTVLHQAGSPPGYKASVFDRVHDHGLRTGLFVTKNQLFFYNHSYGPEHGAPDTTGEDNGRAKIDVAFVKHADSPAMVARFLSEMEDSLPAYSFLHFAEADYAGHSSGWTSPQWRQAVLLIDTQLGLILKALDERPALKAATALVLSADHGGGEPYYTHVDPQYVENVTIPLVLWGPGLPQSADAYTLFSNRYDPGSRIVSNTDPHQPLRNGDTGNIALALLGLPPIEGSFHRPEFRVPLSLHSPSPGLWTLCWPGYLPGMRVEASSSLAADSWVKLELPAVLTGDGAFYVATIPAPAAHTGFFRLCFPE